MMSTGYDFDLDAPLVPQQPPVVPLCAALVVPPHVGRWGFQLRPRLFSFSGNDFVVNDAMGHPVVHVRGKLFSMHAKTMIVDLAGRPLLEISKKVFGFHSTHYLRDPHSGQVVATTRRRLRTMRPKIEMFSGEAHDKDEALMLTMKGDFFGYRWAMINPVGENVAKAVQPNLTAFSAMDQYFVDVAGGVEALLVLAMVIVAEEIHEEQNENRQNQMYY